MLGLADTRYAQPWSDTDDANPRALAATYQSIRDSLLRYVSHQPTAWNEELEVPYLDPVVNDWAHIKAPTLVFGGREDSLTPAFPERMAAVAATIPNGHGRLLLLPGLGHVPHVEAPAAFYPPLLAFLSGR